MEKSALSRSSLSPQKSSTCCICTDKVTCNTIVNTECNHSFCKDCFWRWTKSHNTCPLCRTSLLCNSEELKEQKHLRELLDHRSEIVKQVEDAYDEKDKVEEEMSVCIRRIETLKKALSIPSWKIAALHKRKSDKILRKHELVAHSHFEEHVMPQLRRHMIAYNKYYSRVEDGLEIDGWVAALGVIFSITKQQNKKRKKELQANQRFHQLETEGYGLNRLFDTNDEDDMIVDPSNNIINMVEETWIIATHVGPDAPRDVPRGNPMPEDLLMLPPMPQGNPMPQVRQIDDVLDRHALLLRRAPIFSPSPRNPPSLYREIRNMNTLQYHSVHENRQFPSQFAAAAERFEAAEAARMNTAPTTPPPRLRPGRTANPPPTPTRPRPLRSTRDVQISNNHTPRNRRILNNLLTLIENLD